MRYAPFPPPPPTPFPFPSPPSLPQQAVMQTDPLTFLFWGKQRKSTLLGNVENDSPPPSPPQKKIRRLQSPSLPPSPFSSPPFSPSVEPCLAQVPPPHPHPPTQLSSSFSPPPSVVFDNHPPFPLPPPPPLSFYPPPPPFPTQPKKYMSLPCTSHTSPLPSPIRHAKTPCEKEHKTTFFPPPHTSILFICVLFSYFALVFFFFFFLLPSYFFLAVIFRCSLTKILLFF